MRIVLNHNQSMGWWTSKTKWKNNDPAPSNSTNTSHHKHQATIPNIDKHQADIPNIVHHSFLANSTKTQRRHWPHLVSHRHLHQPCRLRHCRLNLVITSGAIISIGVLAWNIPKTNWRGMRHPLPPEGPTWLFPHQNFPAISASIFGALLCRPFLHRTHDVCQYNQFRNSKPYDS